MIIIILYLLGIAALHSKLELMIEGKKVGWAFSLPCWRKDNPLIHLLLGKELTGYHWYLCLLFLFIFHSPLLFITWNLSTECYIISSYFLYWVAEDVFWFIENPYYGLRNFKKGRISWHKRWFLGLPVSYFLGLLIGGGLLCLGRLLQ